jgi:hypothetical protein
MICDEAPAATISGVDGKGDRLGIVPADRQVQFRRDGPVSVVAAEIHRGKASGHHPRRLADTTYSKHVPVRCDVEMRVTSMRYPYCGALSGS